MSRIGLVLRSACVTLLLFPSLARGSDRALSRVLPADCIGYLCLDVDRFRDGVDQLELVELYRDEEVQDFLEPAIELIERQGGGAARGALTMLESYGIPGLLGGRIEVGLFGPGVVRAGGAIEWKWDQQPSQAVAGPADGLRFDVPDFVISIETAGRQAFEAAIERALELPAVQVRSGRIEEGGVALRATTFDLSGKGHELTLFHGFVGDRFLAAFRPERIVSAIHGLALEGVMDDSLAQADPFVDWRARALQGNEVVEFYVDVEQLIDALAPALSAAERDNLTLFGLDSVQAGGLALAIDEGRIRDSFALLLRGPRSGALRILDAFSPCAPTLDQLPGSSALALTAHFDPGIYLDRMLELGAAASGSEETQQSWMDGMSRQLGVDFQGLVKSLGNAWSVSMHLPRGGLIPDFAGSFRMAPAEGGGGSLQALRGILSSTLGAGGRIQSMTLDGGDDSFFLSLGQLPISPAFASFDDEIRFASSPQALKRILREKRGGLGEEGSDFGRSLESNVGRDRDSVVALFYLDLARVSEWGLEASQMFLPAMLTQLPIQLDASLMPLPDTVSSYLSGLAVTLRSDERAMLIDSSGPVPLVSLNVVAFAALVLGQESMGIVQEPPEEGR